MVAVQLSVSASVAMEIVTVSVVAVREYVVAINNFKLIFKVFYLFTFIANFCHSLYTHINMQVNIFLGNVFI